MQARIACAPSSTHLPDLRRSRDEGAGLSAALLAQTTLQVTIPMPGGFESLNAASAAAICLFEKVRQERSRAA